MSSRVLLTSDGPVATITIDAPERGNSLDAEMLTLLAELLGSLESSARVLLLRGAGERSFSTGYHVPSLLAELQRGLTVSDFESHPLEVALRALDAVPIPTIAVVHGNAYGAGCELALVCDVRLAAEEALLCMPPARLGVLYSATGMRRLLELVGPAVSKEMLYTAEPIDGARALAIGLVNHIVPRAELDGVAARMAATIAANAPLSIRHTKTILGRFLAPPELDPETLRVVATLREECFRSAEFLERTRRLGAKTKREGES